VLSPAALCLSCDDRGSGGPRALQAHGTKAVLRHHDARRGIDRGVWRLAMARVRDERRLATRQARPGGSPHRIPHLVRQAIESFQGGPQYAEPLLVPLVQRVPGNYSACRRHPRCRQAVLGGMDFARSILIWSTAAILVSPATAAADAVIIVQRSPLA